MDKNKFCCETENLTFQFLAMSSSKLAITDESKTNAEPELCEKKTSRPSGLQFDAPIAEIDTLG